MHDDPRSALLEAAALAPDPSIRATSSAPIPRFASRGPRRRYLFVMPYPGYLRYFDSVLHMLCERGHEVFLAFNNPEDRKSVV